MTDVLIILATLGTLMVVGGIAELYFGSRDDTNKKGKE